MKRRLPAPIVVALVAGTGLSIVVQLVVRFWLAESRYVEGIFELGGYLRAAEAVLFAAGALALPSLVGSSARRPLAWIAIASSMIVAALELVFVIVTPIWIHVARDPRSVQRLFDVAGWIGPFAYWAMIASVASLGARRDRPIAIAAAVAATIAAFIRWPIPPLYTLFDHRGDLWLFVNLTLAIVVAGGVIVGGTPGCGDAGVAWAPAARGLSRAATALAWRVVLAVSIIPLLLIAFLARSEGLAKFVAIGFPAAGVLAAIVAIGSMLQASAADTDGAPRVRLALAAFALATGAIFDVLGLVSVMMQFWSQGHESIFRPDDLLITAYLLPAVGLAGTLAFLSAIASIAVRVRAAIASERIVTVAVSLALAVAGSLALQHEMVTARNPDEKLFIFLALASAIVTIAAALAIVRMTRDVANALGGMPSLPTAVARDRS
ncbi:MAG TPA: hypothetical protein VL463_27495 [Kofleriaceae bacterium]|nr:hypothetical protein [Kofleriaceae bacterium]